MCDRSGTEIYKVLESDMVLSESMKVQLAQICRYAETAGIDVYGIRNDLTEKGKLPCKDKNDSKKVLSEIYENVACSF